MISHCVLRKGVSFSVKVFFKLLIQCKINICNPFIQYFININWKDPQAFNWCACMPSFHWYGPSIRCKLWPWWQVSMILWAQLYRLTDVQRVSFIQLVKIHTFVSGHSFPVNVTLYLKQNTFWKFSFLSPESQNLIQLDYMLLKSYSSWTVHACRNLSAVWGS